MLAPITILLLLYGAFVAALTAAEYRRDRRAQYLLKPACALGFILIALLSGAFESLYGQIILAGLCFCAIGDVALLSRKSQTAFLLGMAAFAIGHFLYGYSFLKLGLAFVTENSSPFQILSLGAFITVLFFFSPLSIAQHAPNSIKIAIVFYTLIILVMCMLAVLTLQPMLIAAALLFAISDICVGRDRFISEKSWHALAITPLYFGAQALFALSVSLAL